MSNTDNKRQKTVDGYFIKPRKKSYVDILEGTYSSQSVAVHLSQRWKKSQFSYDKLLMLEYDKKGKEDTLRMSKK